MKRSDCLPATVSKVSTRSLVVCSMSYTTRACVAHRTELTCSGPYDDVKHVVPALA